jgi:hypothetical protein
MLFPSFYPKKRDMLSYLLLSRLPPACRVILQYYGNKYFELFEAFTPFHFPPGGQGFYSFPHG